MVMISNDIMISKCFFSRNIEGSLDCLKQSSNYFQHKERLFNWGNPIIIRISNIAIPISISPCCCEMMVSLAAIHRLLLIESLVFNVLNGSLMLSFMAFWQRANIIASSLYQD